MATRVREQFAVATPNSSHPNPLISHEKLRQLYSMMLKCRLLDERARILGKKAGENDHYSCVGLEATAVGAALDLRPADTLAPWQRHFILSYLKGVPLTGMFNELYGRDTRPQPGHSTPSDCEYSQLNIVLSASTVATPLERCVEIALANQQKRNDNVAMVFPGEGSIFLREWHDALKFAGQRRLPIVFVRQNYPPPVSVPVNLESPGDDISAGAADYGFPGITVDGKDAVAMYRVAQEAIERARSGGGPTLIEAQSLPEYEPTQIDRAQYRTTDRVEKLESRDPITIMERYLTGKGLFSEGWKKEIVAAFEQELDTAIYTAEIDTCGASA
jgi:TPP-dependent pyruvate/acetoin dehydrogenase alpha subunit